VTEEYKEGNNKFTGKIHEVTVGVKQTLCGARTPRTAGCGPACPVVWKGPKGNDPDWAASPTFLLGRARHPARI